MLEKMSHYNIAAALDGIRDKHNEILTDNERIALIVAANLVLENRELVKKKLGSYQNR